METCFIKVVTWLLRIYGNINPLKGSDSLLVHIFLKSNQNPTKIILCFEFKLIKIELARHLDRVMGIFYLYFSTSPHLFRLLSFLHCFVCITSPIHYVYMYCSLSPLFSFLLSLSLCLSPFSPSHFHLSSFFCFVSSLIFTDFQTKKGSF